MKKILSVCILCAICSISANATTKCVALNYSTVCTYDDSVSITGSPTWTVDCGGTTVTGIGVCSNTAICAGPGYCAQSTITISKDPTENKYCWCRMIIPAVSTNYVGYNTYETGTTCAATCAGNCRASMTGGYHWDNALRQRLYSPLMN